MPSQFFSSTFRNMIKKQGMKEEELSITESETLMNTSFGDKLKMHGLNKEETNIVETESLMGTQAESKYKDSDNESNGSSSSNQQIHTIIDASKRSFLHHMTTAKDDAEALFTRAKNVTTSLFKGQDRIYRSSSLNAVNFDCPTPTKKGSGSNDNNNGIDATDSPYKSTTVELEQKSMGERFIGYVRRI